MTRTPRPFRPMHLLVAALAAVALVGCGASSEDGATTGRSTAGTGRLIHVDGTLQPAEDGFVLTPSSGDAAITFRLGPAVQAATVRALEVSGAPARVSYRLTDQEPVAAAVVAAPKIDAGLAHYDGTIVDVDATSLTVDGADGSRTFTIAPQDAAGFDVEHLREHRSQQAPVRIYFDPKTPDAAVAYEDA